MSTHALLQAHSWALPRIGRSFMACWGPACRLCPPPSAGSPSARCPVPSPQPLRQVQLVELAAGARLAGGFPGQHARAAQAVELVRGRRGAALEERAQAFAEVGVPVELSEHTPQMVPEGAVVTIRLLLQGGQAEAP